MVPSWKRALSWVITTSIGAFESTKDRWLPDVPRPSEDPWYQSDEALDGVKPGTLLAHREIEFRGGMAFRGSARAWQLRYCSTDTAGRPISAGRRAFDAVGDMTLEELIGYFPFRRVRELTTVADPFTTDGALAVNEKLSLGRRLPSAPVFLYHTIYDQLVPLSVAEELTATYRAGGVDVILHRSRLGEHVIYHRLSAPAVLRYLAPRLTAAS